MGDSGTSTVLTRYESMRLRTLRQSERTTATDPVNTKAELILIIGWSLGSINKAGRADGVRHFPNIWRTMTNKGETTILKLNKCCTPVNKTVSEIFNRCHYFLSKPCSKINKNVLILRLLSKRMGVESLLTTHYDFIHNYFNYGTLLCAIEFLHKTFYFAEEDCEDYLYSAF